MQIAELIETLEREYPNDVTLLKGKTPEQIAAMIAEIDLIAHIKRLEKDGPDG